jgi:hypothetical protein
MGVLPRFRLGKQALVALCAAVILVGCGGNGSSVPQTISSDGYTATVPGDWKVMRSGRTVGASSGDEIVSVTTFPLARRYKPAMWPNAVVELNRLSVDLATRLNGRVRRRNTIALAGRRARVYDIGYASVGTAFVERVAFLFEGKRELQLLCRFRTDDTVCRAFVRSFRLT